jgi:hypothetical protein
MLSVFLLLCRSIVFPRGRLPISTTCVTITDKEIFSSDETAYADIKQILRQQDYLNDSVLTAIAAGEMPMFDTLKANADSLISSITRIEYPKNDTTVLYPFFRTLKNLPSSGQLIRIMHYGDSQIEDDRITSLLRNRLQSRFGGSGAGLVPASQLYPYGFSMKQSSSENWNRFVGFGKLDTTIGHRRYGALASYCSYIASGSNPEKDTSEAWIRFSSSPYSYQNTKRIEQCRIFYSQNKEPFMNEIYQDQTLLDAEMFPATSHLNVIRWKIDDPGKDILLKFKGSSSPEIYGIALDGRQGIAVDNIPLRGCSGLFFTLFDEQLLAEMYRELNVRLFILQFGGNFVPEASDTTGCMKLVRQQLLRIKLCQSCHTCHWGGRHVG